MVNGVLIEPIYSKNHETKEPKSSEQLEVSVN